MFNWFKKYVPTYEDLQYTCLMDQFKSLFKEGVCTWECPSYAVEHWLNSTREWFEDFPEKKNDCLLWEYYEYAKGWLEGYNMKANESTVPESLEPKPLNLPERFNDMIKTLRNNGQTYVHMLMDNTYTMRELYSQVTSWLNNVDFLRPTLEDCVWYSEIVESENILKEHLQRFERAEEVDCAPEEDCTPEEYITRTNCIDVVSLGDSLYEEGVTLLKRISDLCVDNVPTLHQDIIKWKECFDNARSLLRSHEKFHDIESLEPPLKYFRMGLEAKARFISEDKEKQLRGIANENSRLVQDNLELRNAEKRLCNEIERLEHELDACKEHVAFLQKSTGNSGSSSELYKNTLSIIQNLCKVLDD